METCEQSGGSQGVAVDQAAINLVTSTLSLHFLALSLVHITTPAMMTDITQLIQLMQQQMEV